METMTSRLPGLTPSEPHPLTPLQHGLLVQSLRAPGSVVNVGQRVCRLREPVFQTRTLGAMAHWIEAAAGAAEAAPAAPEAS